jgi:hypothetical protein
MPVPADARALSVEGAGVPRWRQAVARSIRDRREVSKRDRYEIGSGAYPADNHIGTVIVASAWLAFYVVGAIIS